MTTLTVRYKCCGASYQATADTAVACVPKADRMHALDHPSCPPLDQPLNPDNDRFTMWLAVYAAGFCIVAVVVAVWATR